MLPCSTTSGVINQNERLQRPVKMSIVGSIICIAVRNDLYFSPTLVSLLRPSEDLTAPGAIIILK